MNKTKVIRTNVQMLKLKDYGKYFKTRFDGKTIRGKLSAFDDKYATLINCKYESIHGWTFYEMLDIIVPIKSLYIERKNHRKI